MSTCPAEPICDTDAFKADPDIAGIGVIVAFLISAWSSLLFVTAEYLTTTKGENTALLDEIVTMYTRKIIKKPWPLEAMRPAVQMMSDQQLVTGTAILSVGYIQHCTITQYHFYIVYLLGFISCQVYDASLNTLHGRIGKHPIMKLWRAVLMTTLFGMVILNIFIVDHDNFLEYYGSSTQCVWDKLIGAASYRLDTLDLVLSLALLSWMYLEDITLIYPRFFKPLRRALNLTRFVLFRLQNTYNIIQILVSRHEQELAELRHTHISTRPTPASVARLCCSKLINIGLNVMRILLYIIFLPIFTLSELLKSTALNIWRIYSALLWATITINDTKRDANSEEFMEGSESEWGFGQLLPLFLLILPAMAIIELFQGIEELGDKGTENTVTCFNCKRQASLLSSEASSYEATAAHASKPRSNTEPTKNEDYQLDRHDTEARIDSLGTSTADNKLDANHSENDKSDLRRKMYNSVWFQTYLVLCALAAFGGSTYGATQGWVI